MSKKSPITDYSVTRRTSKTSLTYLHRPLSCHTTHPHYEMWLCVFCLYVFCKMLIRGHVTICNDEHEITFYRVNHYKRQEVTFHRGHRLNTVAPLRSVGHLPPPITTGLKLDTYLITNYCVTYHTSQKSWTLTSFTDYLATGWTIETSWTPAFTSKV